MKKKEIQNIFSLQYEGAYLSQESIKDITPHFLFKNNDIFQFSENSIKNAKVALFPELEVHKSKKFIAYNPSIKMLDLEQEQIARRIPKGHFKLTGVPGSGKTVIIMARAIYLLKQNPYWKIKILTYNVQLKNKLQEMLDSMTQSITDDKFNPLNISIENIHKLARRISEIKIPQKKSKDFWETEIIEAARKKAEPEYDAVLIDEYQDFYPNWIQLALEICKKDPLVGEENFFLAGDRVQSIYNKNGEPIWKHLGVHIVGKTKFLKNPYRSKHIRFALRVLAENVQTHQEIKESYENWSEIPLDEKKGIYFLEENNTSSLLSILNEFQSNVKNNLEDLMILVPGQKESEILEAHLPYSVRKNMNFVASKYGSYKAKSISKKNKILVTTYHSSKGIEAKNCILLNIEKLFNNKNTEEFAEHLLFVGITRASEKIYIHGDSSSEIFQKMQQFSGYKR